METPSAVPKKRKVGIRKRVAVVFDRTLQGTWDIICNPITLLDTKVEQSVIYHQVLCAYAQQHANPGHELPEDVVAATQRLTDEQKADLVVLGEIKQELDELEKEAEEEWVTLDDDKKRIILSRACKQPIETVEQYEKEMSKWKGNILTVIILGATAWDVINAVRGPDKSLIPRSSPFAYQTFTVLIGFLRDPARNLMQLWHLLIRDRVFMAMPNRIIYTAGTEVTDFYDDKPSYLSAISVASIIWILATIIPPPIYRRLDQNSMSALGASRGSAGIIPLFRPGGARMALRGRNLATLEQKLERTANYFVLGPGSKKQIGNIRNSLDTGSEMLLRSTDQYEIKKHADHLKKVGLGSFWGCVLAYMTATSARNAGLLGLVIGVVAFQVHEICEDLFFGATVSYDDMLSNCNRLAAPLLWFAGMVNSPLLKNSNFFKDETNVKIYTGILMFVFATISGHTPDITMGIAGGIKDLIVGWEEEEEVIPVIENFLAEMSEEQMKDLAEALPAMVDMMIEALDDPENAFWEEVLRSLEPKQDA